ncbi:hypothetical protein LguiB_002959 [Lonicera macranthoides]
MAILSYSSSLKVLLISTSVLLVALMLKLAAPVIMEFTFTEVPSIWTFILTCLKPPYLYLVINCIIITIVASSKFESEAVEPSQVQVPVALVSPELVKVPADYAVRTEPGYDYDAILNVAKVPEYDVYGHVDGKIAEMESPTSTVSALEEMNGSDEFVVTSNSSSTPSMSKQPTEHSVDTHKPPYSARFAHRKSVKVSPEGGKALGVSKPKRHDTLETTWKTITDGRPMPLTRHLRKSDTWETHGRRQVPQPQPQPQLVQPNQKKMMTMVKSETFQDRSSKSSLRKEPSLSQDELNRRVEAFINKFNEDMRLQRQESLNQYMEMINRGAH